MDYDSAVDRVKKASAFVPTERSDMKIIDSGPYGIPLEELGMQQREAEEGDKPSAEAADHASEGGLIPIAEIKRLILEHYPCYEEDDDEDKVELEVAIAQAQRTHDLAHFRKLVEDVKASHKALKPDIIFGIELACDDILKALKGEA